MRWLVWFAIGFGAGCFAGAYLFRGMGLLALGAVCLALLIPAVLFREKGKWVPALAVLLSGMALSSGMYYGYDALYLTPARLVDGTIREIRFTAADESWPTDYGGAVDGRIELEGRSYQIRLYLDEYYPMDAGDMAEGMFCLRFTDEGGSSEPTFHRTRGILLLGYQEDGIRLERREGSLLDFPGKLRSQAKQLIDTCFPADTAGFAKALLLGDKTDLDDGTSLAFRLTGMSHIVAVSGLHVSILFALIFTLSGKRPRFTALVGIPGVLLFAAVAGFTPSVTRAAVMQVIMMLALVLDREYDPPTALAAAVIGMLVWNPLVIASAGFQLSVTSVAGIYLFYGKIRAWLGDQWDCAGKTFSAKLKRGAASSIAVSISSTLLTTPLVAYYYGIVSLVSLAANLAVMPVISLVFYGIMLACIGGAVLPALGMGIGWTMSWLVRYVFAVTGILGKFPLAAVYTDSPYIVVWMIFCGCLIAALYFAKPKKVWPTVCWGIIGLCVALIASFAEPLLDDYRVTVLDVGQGQCVLLQSRGNTFVVDCGGDYDEDAGNQAAEALLSMGISRVDGLILTHYDRDHGGGVEFLAQRVDIDRVYLPQTPDTDGLLGVITEATADSEQIFLDGDVTISFGSCSIEIFAPIFEKSSNESCAAVLFRGEKYDTLITGDSGATRERELLATGRLPDLEVLIVGHHGSKTSTTAELLYRTAPDVAIISVGEGNAYGHPAAEVLNRLALYGCRMYRTDQHGKICFRG